MFKDIIAPVQAWLMSQGRCVGCGNSLVGGIKKKLNTQDTQITCKKCGRIFIYNEVTKKYHRAPISAV